MLFNLFPKLKWLLALPLLCMFLCCFSTAKGQYFDLENNMKHVSIPFRMVRNMIIIKLKINDQGPFNFILDTGVGLMIITEPNLVDSINLTSKRSIKIPGLGEGEDAEAYISSTLKVDIPGLESHDINAAILKKDHFNLSNYAGMPIDGLLGYEFFAIVAVKINFADSTLNVCRPQDLRPFRKSNRIPISVEQRKPYIQMKVTFTNGNKMDAKMVIDIGAGHPISIENMIRNNGLPAKFIPANLGVGLNGPIDGFISRLKEVDIGKFKVKDVLASFPDDSKAQVVSAVPRDGNLGLGILKKFEVILDYPDNALYLKKRALFNEPSEHDMSGLEYYSTGNFAHIVIGRVEPGSAGDLIGLEKGDEIMSINFKPVAKMTLEEIDSIFKSRDGRGILLEIFHDHRYDKVILTLKRRI